MHGVSVQKHLQGLWLQSQGVYQGNGSLKKKMGCPDLLIVFTNTVSHKMVISASREAKRNKIPVAHVASSSASALHSLLAQRFPAGAGGMK